MMMADLASWNSSICTSNSDKSKLNISIVRDATNIVYATGEVQTRLDLCTETRFAVAM